MTIVIPNALPALHTGNHPVGSGRACIMNAIAYMEGEAKISDMPDCVWRPLALMAQIVNDRICVHGQILRTSCGAAPSHALCSTCAHKVWMMGMPLIGTGETARALTQEQRLHLYARMAERIVCDSVTLVRSAVKPGLVKQARTINAAFAVIQQKAAGNVNGSNHCVIQALSRCEPRMLQGFTAAYRAATLRNETGNAEQLQEAAAILGSELGAERMIQWVALFAGWLNEAAAVQPAAVILTEEKLARVPVAVA